LKVDRIIIKEGSTSFTVPREHSQKGPGSRGESVFFNRQMAFNRDVSIMFLRSLDQKMRIVDSMSATGSRALRIANEVPSVSVVANDIDPRAAKMIEDNVRLNGLNNVTVTNEDLSCLLSREVFDYVDLDPFGSPMPFFHASIRGVKRHGILALTATDTAVLAGARRRKCERRYMARPLSGPICHEAGLRILLGSLGRELARFDRGMVPLLSFYSDHYFRVHVRCLAGAAKADETLEQIGWMSYDRKTLRRSVSCDPEEHPYGPMWLGQLHDPSTLNAMRSDEGLEEPRRCARMLELWREELNTPLTYEVSELSSFLKLPTPPIDRLIRKLQENGSGSRNHISPTAFRSTLPLEKILECYREVVEIDNL